MASAMPNPAEGARSVSSRLVLAKQTPHPTTPRRQPK